MDILYEASTGLGTQGYDATRRAGDPHPPREAIIPSPDPIARGDRPGVRVGLRCRTLRSPQNLESATASHVRSPGAWVSRGNSISTHKI